MPAYGKTSRARLDTCHPDLQLIFNTAIAEVDDSPFPDISILEGFRPEGRQNQLLRDGMTTVAWPNSNHNCQPSKAVDAAVYHSGVPHIHWADKEEFWAFSKWIFSIAERLYKEKKISHLLRWGGDWDGDGVPVYMDKNETFWDGPHFELVTPKDKRRGKG